MAARSKPSDQTPNQTRRAQPPATTLEGREGQRISLAMDLAEQQMLNGTASSQIITQFLKEGTVRSQLELEKIRKENLLLESRRSSIESEKATKDLYENALSAFRSYSGNEVQLPEEEWDED